MGGDVAPLNREIAVSRIYSIKNVGLGCGVRRMSMDDLKCNLTDKI